MLIAKRKLGNTGLDVSVLGLGTVKFGRNTDVKYPYHFTIPSDAEVANLLALTKDHGINLLDTAPAYGNSEERLGKLLGNARKDWIIVGKAGEEYINSQSNYDFRKDKILDSIKRSLTRLKTDYIDVLLIHSNGDDVDIINKYDVFETLNIAKKQGLIRFGGMSTKTIEGGLLTLQHSDVAMVWYSQSHTEESLIIDQAYNNNKGILVKKALDSGNTVSTNPLQFVLKHPGVNCIVIGSINQQHILDNIKQTLSS